MGFFKPEDFYKLIPDWQEIDNLKSIEAMADIANAKLERESKHVWSVSKRIWDSFNHPEDMNVYEGLLVNIKTVKEKCTHEPSRIRLDTSVYGAVNMIPPPLVCTCGARMKPKEFEEVK